MGKAYEKTPLKLNKTTKERVCSKEHDRFFLCHDGETAAMPDVHS